MAAVCAEREWHDHLAAKLIAHRLVYRHGGRGLDGGEIGPERDCDEAETQHGAKPAKPSLAANVLSKVRSELDCMATLFDPHFERIGTLHQSRAQVGKRRTLKLH